MKKTLFTMTTAIACSVALFGCVTTTAESSKTAVPVAAGAQPAVPAASPMVPATKPVATPATVVNKTELTPKKVVSNEASKATVVQEAQKPPVKAVMATPAQKPVAAPAVVK